MGESSVSERPTSGPSDSTIGIRTRSDSRIVANRIEGGIRIEDEHEGRASLLIRAFQPLEGVICLTEIGVLGMS